MKNRKLISLLLCILLCGMLVVSCTPTTQVDGPKFGIISMVENGAFTDMKEGIIAGLADAGYIDGESCTIDYQCAGGDAGTLATIANAMNDGSYTAIFCIATPTTQAYVNMGGTTPCFFCAVSSPVAAGVITDLAKPDKNATGTSNAIPVADIIEMARALDGDLSKIGLISSGSETNATNTIAQAKAYLDSCNIEYYEVIAQNSSEVSTAAAALIDAKCDAVFVPNDATVQAGIASLAELCNEAGIPTYCSSATTVDSGCFAAVAIDDVEIGRLTASLFLTYQSGTPIESIPAIVCDIDYCSVYVNRATADQLSLTLPDTYEVIYRD